MQKKHGCVAPPSQFHRFSKLIEVKTFCWNKKQNSSFVEYRIALDTIFGINLDFVMLNTNDATIPVCDQTQLQPQYSIELILIAILHHRVINYEKS